MDGVVEVITGRERRRRWSTPFKLRVVAETQEPGAQVRAVVARHGVCESLVFTWRRQVREGVLTEPELPVVSAPSPVVPPASAPPRPQAGLMEIELGDGRQVRVGADVNLAALKRVLAALRGWPTLAIPPATAVPLDLAA